MKIGIIAAVPEEIKTIHDHMHFHTMVEHAEYQIPYILIRTISENILNLP